MIASQSEYAPACQKIQIPAASGVEKPRTLAVNVVLIEPDGSNHLYEGWIKMAFVQFVLPPLLGVEPPEESLVHSERGGVPELR